MIKYVLMAFVMLFPMSVMAETDPALQGKQAENFISTLGNDAIQALQDTRDDTGARHDALQKILNNNFDTATIARFALGRYWAVATEDEKKEYSALFKKMIVDVYTQRFAEYTDQDFRVVGNKPAGNDFIVQSLINQKGGQPVHVDWRVRQNKVIDVIVEGISMSVTQRSEFASIIQRNGGQVASLISNLKK